ncbi:hypothetical protein ACER0C_001362 [Sarotherodon galilaeus]
MSPDSLNDYFLHPNLSSINSNLPLALKCFVSSPSSLIFTTFSFTNVFLIVPLSIPIIFHGIQQKRTNSPTATSHSDIFTYHMTILSLIGVFGCILCCLGIYSVHFNTVQAGFNLYAFTVYGEVFFQYLTCVERYLAVVHPITYLSLRNERGIMIRNISIGCIWMLSLIVMGLMMIQELVIILNFFLGLLSVTIICYLTFSVLYILIRPGPGEQGVNRERFDQSKLRAFYTMVAILGVLLLRFSWGIYWISLFLSNEGASCTAMISGVWFNLPCTLVLPVLFLYKAGKFVFFKNEIQ